LIKLVLGLAFGLAQTSNAVAFLPLAALFEQLQSFKPFKHVSLATQGGSRSQTPML
jgi:hypothetical protein